MKSSKEKEKLSLTNRKVFLTEKFDKIMKMTQVK